jgi:hypothetical protein
VGLNKRTLEDLLLYIIIAVVVLFLCWLLTGCTSTNRTASIRYKSTCEWRLAGGEVITADRLEQEFEILEGCKLKRKTDVSKENNEFH